MPLGTLSWGWCRDSERGNTGVEGLGTPGWGAWGRGSAFPAPPVLHLLCCSFPVPPVPIPSAPSAPHSQCSPSPFPVPPVLPIPSAPSPHSGFSHCPFPVFPVPVPSPPSSHSGCSHSPSPVFPVPIPSATFPALPPPSAPTPPTHMETICGWFSPFEGLHSPQPHCCVVTAGCGGPGGAGGVPHPGMGMGVFPSWAQ